jgi:ABC-type oligopeptide transport system substrate-binding subunit
VEPVDEARFIANVLVKQWRAIGLDVTAEPGRADFFDRVVAGNYDLALAYYGPFIPSPEQYLWMYREAAIPVPNVMQFKSAAFEQAFSRYVTLPTPRAREEPLRMALSVLLNNPPSIWILQPPRFVATTTMFDMQRSAGLPNYQTLTASPAK